MIDYNHQCYGKIVYCHDEAKRRARLRRRACDERIGYYRCELCGGFHIGHHEKENRKKRTPNKYRRKRV